MLGLHFFNPPSVMRLVEVVRGERTSAPTAEAGVALARAMGKTPVAGGRVPGLPGQPVLVRAMAAAYRRAAGEGADPGRWTPRWSGPAPRRWARSPSAT